MDLHYFRPLEAHPLPSRLEKKSGKAVWNPSKLGMRSLWECHVPPKVPRLCWKQNHDLPELQKTEGERDWSIIPAGWNHWESKADAWLKSWRYIIYIVYIYYIYIYHQPPVFFLEEMAGYLLYTEIWPCEDLIFFQNSPILSILKLDPQLVASNIFFGVSASGSQGKTHPPPRKKTGWNTWSEVPCWESMMPFRCGASIEIGRVGPRILHGLWRLWKAGGLEMRSLEPERSIYIYICLYIFLIVYIHPWSLNMVHLKISHWKRRFLVETIVFQVPC